MSAGILGAARLVMPNGVYRGVPLGVVLLEHDDLEYLTYLAKHRGKEPCGRAARILLRDLCSQRSVEELGLVEELNAEAAAAGWAAAA